MPFDCQEEEVGGRFFSSVPINQHHRSCAISCCIGSKGLISCFELLDVSVVSVHIFLSEPQRAVEVKRLRDLVKVRSTTELAAPFGRY